MAYTGVRRTLETLNRLEWLDFWFIGVRLMIRDSMQPLELELTARGFCDSSN